MNDRKSVLLLIAAALVVAAVLAAFKAFDSPGMNAAEKVSVTLTHRKETPTVKGKVNINTADIEELMTLENVGEAKAAQIIEYRTENGYFRSIEELMNIEGIGEETVEANRSRIII